VIHNVWRRRSPNIPTIYRVGAAKPSTSTGRGSMRAALRIRQPTSAPSAAAESVIRAGVCHLRESPEISV
jgi:hypothetical protein